MLISNETFIGVSVTARVLIAKRERIFSQSLLTSVSVLFLPRLFPFSSPCWKFSELGASSKYDHFSNFANMSNDLNNFPSLFDLSLNVNY